jgi:membrane protein
MISDVLKRGRVILRATYREYKDDQVGIIASGVAFRVAIAVFPAVALLVWVGARVFGHEGIEALQQTLSGIVPDASRKIVVQAIQTSMQSNPADRNGEYGYLGAAAPLAGLIFMIYSANSGMQALFNAMNVIYDTQERRSFLRFNAITLLFTVGALAAIAVATSVIATPALLAGLDGTRGYGFLWRWSRWPVLFVATAAALALLYRYAPHRAPESWPLVTLGSALAALLIVLSTALFSWFTTMFGNLAVTYGSLSTVVIFMLWLWAIFWIVLACAELDSCIDAETGIYAKKKPAASST